MTNVYELQKAQAVADCKAGRYSDAEPVLRELLNVLRRHGGSIDSSDIRYWYLVARHRGDTEKAMGAFLGPSDVGEMETPPIAATASQSPHIDQPPDGEVDVSLGDERFVRALDLLTRDLEFPPQEFFQGRLPVSVPERSEAIRLLDELRQAYPDAPSVYAAYAFALEVEGKAISAVSELEAACGRFPDCWQLDLMRRREWLWVANPLRLPAFSLKREAIHPALNAILISNLIVLTRQGALPRAIMLYKDGTGEFDPRKLPDARMAFTTMISPVTSPQLVAVMGRIFDNPAEPFNLEEIDAPFRPHSHHRRVTLEYYYRQEAFEFVIVDQAGRVIHARTIPMSDRMAAVHGDLRRRFDAEPGSDTTIQDFASAMRRHQSLVDQNSVQY